MPQPAVYVGIDVAQATLVVAVRPEDRSWTVANDAAGVATLQRQLQRRAPALIVLEATGGLERLVASSLGTAGLPVAVVNPRQVRDFAKATGQLAKTDALDAQVLAHFAATVRPPPRPPRYPDRGVGGVTDAAAPTGPAGDRRAAPVGPEHPGPGATTHPGPCMLAAAGAGPRGRRLGSGPADQSPVACPGILAAPGADAHAAGGAAGVGHVVPPAGGDLGRGGPAQSGQWHLARPAPHVGGRRAVRAVLYMATLAATRYPGPIRVFYQRLCAAGKAKQVALVACMRKLLTILNAMLRDQRSWQPPAVTTA